MQELELQGTVFEESPNQHLKTIFPMLDNLYVDDKVKQYKDVDNNFSLCVISLQILEIVYSVKNPRMSQDFKHFLANKLSHQAKQGMSLKPLMESQAFKSVANSLQMRMRASLATDKLAENYLKNKEKAVQDPNKRGKLLKRS